MDKKRMKRSKGNDEEGMWDCSVCTFKNSAEAFKCAMCDVRKGTSTRKPKPNPQLLVAQQVVQQSQLAAAATTSSAKKQHSAATTKRSSTSSAGMAGDSTAGETDTSMDSSDVPVSHKNSRSFTPPSVSHKAAALAIDTTTVSTPSSSSSLVVSPGRSKNEETKKSETKKKLPKQQNGSKPSHSTAGGKRPSLTPNLSLEVTVGDVTVIITDYKPKRLKQDTKNTPALPSSNNSLVEGEAAGGLSPGVNSSSHQTPSSNPNNTSTSSMSSSDSCETPVQRVITG